MSDACVERGGTPLLRNVGLRMQPGEVLAVIGPNGAGKSTLLQALSGALPLDAGEAALDGLPLRDWPRQALARRRAVLPQASQLAFPFRVRDVVRLGRTPHAGHSDKRHDRRAAEAALAATDLTHLAERVYTTLSGGERQRVQLARVLAQIQPVSAADGKAAARYMLLDEPTNNLDIAHQHSLMTTARRFAAQGNGVLAVLHDPNLAALHADRVCVLDQGAIIAEGTPEAIFTEDLFARIFQVRTHILHHPATGGPVMVPG